MGGIDRLAGLTSDGISVAMASASQRTPLRKGSKILLTNLENHGQWKSTHLFPEETAQAKSTTIVTTQNEQAS